jgi:SAM-dependent methyltransferase
MSSRRDGRHALGLALLVMAGAPQPTALETIRAEAARLEAQVRAPWVKQFLRATAELPEVAPRVFYRNADRTRVWTEKDALALPESERAALQRLEAGEDVYYTRYSTPLAYARPLDILAAEGFAPRGRKLVDFGYGNVGQLKLLALLGAQAVGVEVDPLLPLLYAAENGPVRARDGTAGRLQVLHGRFPAEAAVVDALGHGYDVFLSKNTLKRGYVHPEQPVPERQRIDLGVSDAEYVRAVHRLLAPGGYFLIYNLSPAPAPEGKPYLPWADGRSPFSAETLAAEGFEVLAFDRDDSPAARAMAHALGWDAGEKPMDLEKDLFGRYTLARKKRR